jgi:hypothetical protein
VSKSIQREWYSPAAVRGEDRRALWRLMTAAEWRCLYERLDRVARRRDRKAAWAREARMDANKRRICGRCLKPRPARDFAAPIRGKYPRTYCKACAAEIERNRRALAGLAKGAAA